MRFAWIAASALAAAACGGSNVATIEPDVAEAKPGACLTLFVRNETAFTPLEVDHCDVQLQRSVDGTWTDEAVSTRNDDFCLTWGLGVAPLGENGFHVAVPESLAEGQYRYVVSLAWRDADEPQLLPSSTFTISGAASAVDCDLSGPVER